MENVIPVLDNNFIQEKANEFALKGAVECIKNYYTGYDSPYKKAIETCQEVRFITGGRLAFLDPETGKPTGGNNKGSMFLIWHPYAKGKLIVSHVDRDTLMSEGAKIIEGYSCSF